MLIEVYTQDFSELIQFMDKHGYSLLENFSKFNRYDTPYWDGLYNDYLFMDMRGAS